MDRSQNLFGEIFKCLLCGFLFNITAFLGAALHPVFALMIFPAVYFFAQLCFFLDRRNSSRYYFCVILTVIFALAILLLLFRAHFLYNLYVVVSRKLHRKYSEPSAVTGLIELISLQLNACIMIVSIIISFITRLLQKKKAKAAE